MASPGIRTFASVLFLLCLFVGLFMYLHQVTQRDDIEISRSLHDQKQVIASEEIKIQNKNDINRNIEPKESAHPKSNVDWLQVFKFVPNVLRECQQLFGSKWNFPDTLLEKYAKFQDYVSENVKLTEGHSGEYNEERMVFYKMANAPFVKTICETGFNAGHSSFTWLESNPDVKVYSFDIGGHDYARVMERYLQKEYPGRLKVTWGDSTITIPEFHEKYPNVSCDVILIDGGHSSEVCLGDFYNFKKMASFDNVVILDNYPERRFNFQNTIGNCWEKVKRLGEVIEIFNCNYDPVKLKALGFTVGRYNKV